MDKGITRIIEYHRSQVFVLSELYCTFCGKKGFYELEHNVYGDDFQFCPHCKENHIFEIHNPDYTLPELDSGRLVRIVDACRRIEYVTKTEEEWQACDQFSKALTSLTRSLAESFFGRKD